MNHEIFKNKLIIFEGCDETGKSSVAELFARDLEKTGQKVVFTKQPGGDWGPMAPLFRSMCKDKRFNMHSYTNLFLFLADRIESLDKIVQPALERGKTVVSDRWSYSTVAYQLYGKGMLDDFKRFLGSDEKVLVLKEWIENSFFNIEPDFVFYFPTKIGNRAKDLNDNFDHAGGLFETRVKNCYEELSDKLDWYTIEPGSSAEETLTNLYTKIEIRDELI